MSTSRDYFTSISGCPRPVTTLCQTSGCQRPVTTLCQTSGCQRPVTTLRQTSGCQRPVTTLRQNISTHPFFSSSSFSRVLLADSQYANIMGS